MRSLSAFVLSARSLILCSGSASRFPWFTKKNVAFPDRICACIRGENEKRAKRNYTVRFMHELAFFGEHEVLLHGYFWDGAFHVGRDVYGVVWTI